MADREPMSIAGEALDSAIASATGCLESAQRDGLWDYKNPMGPRTTGLVLAVEHYLGLLTEEDAAAGLRWLEDQADSNGSFIAHYSADEPGLGTTGTAYAGMVAALDRLGLGIEDRPVVAQTKKWLWTRLDDVDPGTLLVLALAGAIDSDRLQSNYVFFFALPFVRRYLQKRFNPGAIMFMMALGTVTIDLRHRQHGKSKGLLWNRATREIEDFLLPLQNPPGVDGRRSWFDLPIATSWFLAALHGAGMPSDDPRIQAAKLYLDSRKHRTGEGDETRMKVIALDSEVWNTGLALRSLMLAGTACREPVIQQGVSSLAGMQILDHAMPTLSQPKPDAPRTGGWAFTDENPLQPDTDDTGVALAGLARVLRAEHADELALCVGRGTEWLLHMQNPDGGWGAFAYGLPAKAPGPLDATLLMNPPKSLRGRMGLFLRPPREMGDPSTAGLTGRLLYTLAELGFGATDRPVVHAMEFLERQLIDSERYWGMWMVNYLPATSCVLLGVGVMNRLREKGPIEGSTSLAFVRRASDFLISKQNSDGGWGEEPISYLDASQMGRGTSMPALTGLVVMALVEAGYADTEAVASGVRYLLETQSEGTWKDVDWLQVVLFPTMLYANQAHPRVFPLEALIRYRGHLHQRTGRAAPPVERGPDLWTDSFLDEMRELQDPVADEVIAGLVETSGLDEVNALLRQITETDEPLPPSLPPVAVRFFEETKRLPDWVDDDRVKRGQLVFGDHAFAMIATLFAASLPEAYAAAKGSQVLAATERLDRDIDNRILETAQFLLDTMSEGGLDPTEDQGDLDDNPFTGRGIRTVQKVRLIHAAVRHLIARSGRWDPTLGQPINQEDLAGTLMTFSVVVLEACRTLRIELSAEQQEDYLYAWRVVGHLLGVDPRVVPQNVVEARTLMTRIRQRQHMQSPQGIGLAHDLVEAMNRHTPWFVPKSLPPVLVRQLIGDPVADMLKIRRHPVMRLVVEKVFGAADKYGWFEGRANEHVKCGAGGQGKARRLARLHMFMVRRMLAAKRRGKEVRFRIPERLRIMM